MPKTPVNIDPLDDISELMNSVKPVRPIKPVADILEEMSNITRPSEIATDMDIETSVQVMSDDLSFEPPVPTPLEGDMDDPFDKRSFAICANEVCSFRAGCLRWRLRKQRLNDFPFPVQFFADQDNCLVRADKYQNDFALDPVDDVSKW